MSTCPTSPQLVGDPVDTLTGAVTDEKLEFRLVGPIELRWLRLYDSAQSHRQFALGWGQSHAFERRLHLRGDVLVYVAPLGEEFAFPLPKQDGDEVLLHGYTLLRVTAHRYVLRRHGQASMGFEFRDPDRPARLGLLFDGMAQVRFHYDNAGHLGRIVDSCGRRILVEEAPHGRLLSLTLLGDSGDADRLLVAYEYDAEGCLARTRYAEGYGYTFTYDDRHRLLCCTGRKGFQFHYQYDGLGRCVLSSGEQSLYGVALEFVSPGRQTRVTRADGGVWSYVFDPVGRLTKVLDPLGGQKSFLRDLSGRLMLERGPAGSVTRLEYDEAGAPIARVDHAGHAHPLPEDPNEPDPLDERVASTAAEFEYGALLDNRSGLLPSVAELVATGLPATVRGLVFTRPAGAALFHRPAFAVEPLGALWWPLPEEGREFNHFGRLVAQRDEFGRERRWSYDPSGNLREWLDFDGQHWKYDTGRWHLLVASMSPTLATQHWAYTAFEEVLSFTDAGGTRTEFLHDQADHLVEVRRQGEVRDVYGRDLEGRLVSKHSANARPLFKVQLGPLGLPQQWTLASGDTLEWEYDDQGRVLKADTAIDKLTFAFDDEGHRTQDFCNGTGIEHNFLGGERLFESILFDRFVIAYRWTGQDRLTIQDPTGGAHGLTFLPHRLVERHFSNGTQETSQHDLRGRCLLKAVSHRQGRLWSRRFHWSGEGELRKVEDSEQGEIRHCYDAAHRLCERHSKQGVESYVHDQADNLVVQPGLHAVVLNGNRVSSANGETFTYDDRHHVAVRSGSSSEVRFHYDECDQLVRIDHPRGIWTAEYDAMGRRRRKTWRGRTTEFHWNADQLVAEQDPAGRLRIYVYADPLALTPLMFVDYDGPYADPASGTRWFVLSDQLGTPCVIEDDTGSPVWRCHVQPFGAGQVWSPGGLEFNFRFPGHYLDPETGLFCNRFRYYDPVLGRYLQSDPWGLAGGGNVYAYRPNPLLEVDVRGLGEEGDKKCGKPKKGEEGKKKPTPAKGKKPLAEMNDAELGAHVQKRAAQLKRLMKKDNPRSEGATTLSVGVVQKGNDKSTRKVVVTTSADNQQIPPSVKGSMKRNGEEPRQTKPKIVRSEPRENPDNPGGKDPNKPKTITDPLEVTGENPRTTRPYEKAENGEPVGGTKHHAEQRMETGAAENGEKVVTQQPTKKCCPGCTKVLGDNDNLSKVPAPGGV